MNSLIFYDFYQLIKIFFQDQIKVINLKKNDIGIFLNLFQIGYKVFEFLLGCFVSVFRIEVRAFFNILTLYKKHTGVF